MSCRLVFAAITTAFLLPGLLLAPPAQAGPVENYTVTATPAVCATLDSYPTFAGVLGVVEGVVNDTGFSYFDAGRVVGGAVVSGCPEHLPLLQRFIATYSDKGYAL